MIARSWSGSAWPRSLLLLVGLLPLLFWLAACGGGGEAPAGDEGEVEEEAEPLTLADGEAVDLFFPGDAGRLYPEERLLPRDATAEERMTKIAEMLLAGPETASLRPPLPDGVTLGQAYLMVDGTAVLDLISEKSTPPSSGSEREILTVYSLVNSVLRNVEGAEDLILLWNGQQPASFAGHLDTSRPLGENLDLIAGLSE